MSNRTESYLVGLVGDGVMPSLSPHMHERGGDLQGLRYLYRPIDLLQLGLPATSIGDLLQSASRMGFNGLNITHPCKQLVLEHLDEIAPDAERLGAVNTVVIQDGRITEAGSHQELLRREGVYARLFTMQAEGYR